jgi:two-component system chemotaxis sensor kinase CheA
VRDLSRSLGKQIRVEMQGAETELDKTIIEAIKDPLTHMVRNSVDHGVELPDQRVAAGKPAEGRILLRARHDGGQVVVEIDDDGRGIDPARIRAKAVEKAVITAEQAARMSDREAVNLIFAPGFSTAEQVTSISGRGVGMDVVRTNIERIGGSVDVLSRPGLGATVQVKIPLTLAIIPALVVTSAGQRFAIPQVSLLELVSVPADKVATQIETVYDARVLRLRGQLLPLVDLAHEIGLPPPPPGPVRIVILQADHRQYGLIVEAVQDTQEIVVKPLGRQFEGVEVFSGATIMGDGRVALIVDPVGLAKRAKVAARKDAAPAHAGAESRVLTPLLVFRSPDDGRMAVPLAQVSRLEELQESQVERMGTQEVVQYRGGIMPLVRVFRTLSERRKAPRNPDAGVKPGTLPVVVHIRDGQAVGLVVGEILDTVEEDIRSLKPASRAGIQGCLVVRGKVTELLAVEHIVRTALPALVEA